MTQIESLKYVNAAFVSSQGQYHKFSSLGGGDGADSSPEGRNLHVRFSQAIHSSRSWLHNRYSLCSERKQPEVVEGRNEQ